MKTHLKLLLGVSLVCLLCSGVATAQEAATGTPTTPSISATVEDAKEEAKEQKALKDRVEARKTKQNPKMTPAEQLRLQGKCTNAQGAIKSLQSRIHGVETSRTKVYANFDDRVGKLADRLDSLGVDSAELRSQRGVVGQKVIDFKAEVEEYKQIIADLTDMECTKDPTAFRASLEAARVQRTKIAASSSDIRTYITETIKPTIQQLRASVVAAANNNTEAQ